MRAKQALHKETHLIREPSVDKMRFGPWRPNARPAVTDWVPGACTASEQTNIVMHCSRKWSGNGRVVFFFTEMLACGRAHDLAKKRRCERCLVRSSSEM